ncbi:tyrosine transporter TyrP [Malaciobacter halophilus]|uniref:Tyrosine transporter TyrP n=1 Tax=Malaciobacter halophilus TaxID=197482 RepID=A0A2N1J3U2_9BACT|nr:aromatic amino acid transport family protein [Malaciobacter halophilus]AXH08701.1 tyrosine transporter TyrP [Malaciobacter halophilus]PKI81227.1 tyrosine transporter TyrP [Malaciobacter halophilus]
MNKNKLFGSMLIIAGTTIGAGMLALPIASAGLGFTVSSIVMIVIWAFMAYTALLMIEVHQFASKDATLHTLAYKLLGRKGQVVASFSMMFLFYALCAAYIAGGGEQVYEKLKLISEDFPIQSGAIIFTLIISSVVTISTRSVDLLNRFLFVVKFVVLAVMLAFLFPFTSIEKLVNMPTSNALVLASLPVVFTSFGFHGSIPSIVKYVGKDIKSLKIIMLTGSALPLIVYILWQLVSHGSISQTQLLENESLSSFINALSVVVNSSYISAMISIFANLALATSFLGVSLGLFDFIQDVLSSKEKRASRVIASLVTFLPPLGFALFYPQGFIKALGFAAFALVILALFLPAAMVYKQRQSTNEGYKVAGGNFALVLVALFGLCIILVQVLQIFKVL